MRKINNHLLFVLQSTKYMMGDTVALSLGVGEGERGRNRERRERGGGGEARRREGVGERHG